MCPPLSIQISGSLPGTHLIAQTEGRELFLILESLPQRVGRCQRDSSQNCLCAYAKARKLIETSSKRRTSLKLLLQNLCSSFSRYFILRVILSCCFGLLRLQKVFMLLNPVHGSGENELQWVFYILESPDFVFCSH